MYILKIKDSLKKKLEKLGRKDSKQAEIIARKSEEIVVNPQHYKNLRKPLQYLKAVHIDKHFVLTFSVDENNKLVLLEDYDHHDKIYEKSK